MKLEKVGIKGQCKQWIMEYLRDRQQYVRNGGINSDCKSINYGIPRKCIGPKEVYWAHSSIYCMQGRI